MLTTRLKVRRKSPVAVAASFRRLVNQYVSTLNLYGRLLSLAILHTSRASRIPRRIPQFPASRMSPSMRRLSLATRVTHFAISYNFRARAVRVALFPSCFQLPSASESCPSLHRQTAEQKRVPWASSLVRNDRSTTPRCELVTATANGRGVYESLSPETLTFTALPRAAPAAAALVFLEGKISPTDGFVSFWPGKAPPTTSPVTARLYCGNGGS